MATVSTVWTRRQIFFLLISRICKQLHDELKILLGTKNGQVYIQVVEKGDVHDLKDDKLIDTEWVKAISKIVEGHLLTD